MNRKPVFMAIFLISLVIPLCQVFTEVSAQTEYEGDYDPANNSWNGFSEILLETQALGYKTTIINEYDFEDVSRNEILIIIYPTSRLESELICDYVSKGGRVLIANDFGGGLSRIDELHLAFSQIHVYDMINNYDERGFTPLVGFFSRHPITRGVSSVVTNHPTFLSVYGNIESRNVIARFYSTAYADEDGDRMKDDDETSMRYPFAFAKILDSGKIAVISDPSIFINEVFRLGDNRLFYRNIVSWLSDGDLSSEIVFLLPTLEPAKSLEPINTADPIRFSNILQGDLGLLFFGTPYIFIIIGVLALAFSTAFRPRLRFFEEKQIRPSIQAGLNESPGVGGYSHAAKLLCQRFIEEVATSLNTPEISKLESNLQKEILRRYKASFWKRIKAENLIKSAYHIAFTKDYQHFDEKDFRRLYERLNDIFVSICGRRL